MIVVGKTKKHKRVIQVCDQVISVCVLSFFFFSYHFFFRPLFLLLIGCLLCASNKFMYPDRGNYPILYTGPMGRKWVLMCTPHSGASNSQRKCAFTDISTLHALYTEGNDK